MQTSQKLFKHPFSKEYWRTAAAEFKDTRTLVFAALMIALRVALKGVKIPLGPYLDINSAFLVNAVGAMTFGPLMAVAAAAVTDTLGCLLFPSGPYYFPFIFVEIAGSLIFALLLYRTEVTVWRLLLARFLIDFLVNVVMTAPIMVGYQEYAFGKAYPLIDVPRILKNLVMFPLESVALVIFLRYVIPPLYREKYVFSSGKRLFFTKKTVALLVGLTLAGTACVAVFVADRYNNRTISAEYSSDERYNENERMNAITLEKYPDLDPETTVSIIDSATSTFMSPVVTYEISVYQADVEAINARAAADPEAADMRAVRGYSKSKPAKDDALTKLPELGYTRVEAKTSYNTVMILLVLVAMFLSYKVGKFRGEKRRRRED